MVAVLCSQRDRFRKRASELEEENMQVQTFLHGKEDGGLGNMLRLIEFVDSSIFKMVFEVKVGIGNWHCRQS
jgi:hypothetical protein